jgi:hypothetical protein
MVENYLYNDKNKMDDNGTNKMLNHTASLGKRLYQGLVYKEIIKKRPR